MSAYLGAFVVFGLVMAGMAVGVIFGDRRIRGSCGGVGNSSTPDGEPTCACGRRAGQVCGAGAQRRLKVDAAGDALTAGDTDEGPSHPAPRPQAESVAV